MMPIVTGATYDRLLELLATDERVQLVYAFGSAAADAGGPLSDVDVAVLLDAPLDWDAERELRGRLGAAVPRLDLVILNDAPPVLRFEVITNGRCLFARDTRQQAEFEIVSLARFLDFQPVRRVQQEYLRARVEERRGAAD
jgi:predicted nucleotidyltransferase